MMRDDGIKRRHRNSLPHKSSPLSVSFSNPLPHNMDWNQFLALARIILSPLKFISFRFYVPIFDFCSFLFLENNKTYNNNKSSLYHNVVILPPGTISGSWGVTKIFHLWLMSEYLGLSFLKKQKVPTYREVKPPLGFKDHIQLHIHDVIWHERRGTADQMSSVASLGGS